MPRRPLSELRPRDFPKVGDEENAFDSDNEDTDYYTSAEEDEIELETMHLNRN